MFFKSPDVEVVSRFLFVACLACERRVFGSVDMIVRWIASNAHSQIDFATSFQLIELFVAIIAKVFILFANTAKDAALPYEGQIFLTS